MKLNIDKLLAYLKWNFINLNIQLYMMMTAHLNKVEWNKV